MDAKQKIHQANLELWIQRFKDKSASGLTVKEWCEQNNLSVHAYNYWKHLAKQSYINSILPDIVPVPLPAQIPAPMTEQYTPIVSRDSRNSIQLSLNDIHIDIGPNAPDDIILSIIKAVRHV